MVGELERADAAAGGPLRADHVAAGYGKGGMGITVRAEGCDHDVHARACGDD